MRKTDKRVSEAFSDFAALLESHTGHKYELTMELGQKGDKLYCITDLTPERGLYRPFGILPYGFWVGNQEAWFGLKGMTELLNHLMRLKVHF